MRFIKFEIRNFKGIKSATLDLIPTGAGVYTLIGLNESGKTTALEAIDDFGVVRDETEALYGEKRSSLSSPARFIPKHLEANFTGKVLVSATVEFSDEEIVEISECLKESSGFRIDKDSIPKRFVITRGYRFENSDLKARIHEWDIKITGKKRKAKSSSVMNLASEEGKEFVRLVTKSMPVIVYFPTFLFSIPDKIILNPSDGNESSVNRHYRQIIQDVASSLSSPLDIKTHLVDRILTEKSMAEQFLSLWALGSDKEKQINATLNALSAHLTKTVFDSWGKIFTGNFSGRELLVRLAIDNKDTSKQIYLKIILKEGQQEYDVSERSLGFRWFFSFLLFTYYRVYAKGRGATLFLLDEPASNLHSRAQTQLLDSFARIADGKSSIMYSTHSHYMINPDWLDQAYVVANKAIDYENDVGHSENNPTEIAMERYRRFVGSNPDKTTYFQPVLDKLDVVPSRLDLLRPSVLLEGKADFYVLEYGRRVLLRSDSDIAVVPTRGAAGMDELIGLLLGWGVDFAICLDSDRAGEKARTKYLEEWALPPESVFTLRQLDTGLSGKRVEDLLNGADLKLIAERMNLSGPPSKSQVQLFFSEALARKETLPLSDSFRKYVESFERMVQSRFQNVGPKRAKRGSQNGGQSSLS